MSKELSEMSLEELWQLFPIFLCEHKSEWDVFYYEMETFLKDKLKDYKIVRISHIGSTAIKTIWAKPIIDILVEIDNSEDINIVGKTIENIGFIKMHEEKNWISFNKGYSKEGFEEKVYHLHLRYEGNNDELYFRDYLIDNPEVAKEYEKLKLSLWKKYEHNRDAYTDAKTDFIKENTIKAKILYKDRYK